MIRGTPKIFRYLRGEKATRGNFNFRDGVKTLAETMLLGPFLKKIFMLLALTAALATTNAAIQKKIQISGMGTTTLII